MMSEALAMQRAADRARQLGRSVAVAWVSDGAGSWLVIDDGSPGKRQHALQVPVSIHHPSGSVQLPGRSQVQMHLQPPAREPQTELTI
jgi:hypothetical protein